MVTGTEAQTPALASASTVLVGSPMIVWGPAEFGAGVIFSGAGGPSDVDHAM